MSRARTFAAAVEEALDNMERVPDDAEARWAEAEEDRAADAFTSRADVSDFERSL